MTVGIGLMFAGPIALLTLFRWVPMPEEATTIITVASILGWFGFVTIGSNLITCPKCGTPVFFHKFGIIAAWPAEECSNCVKDFTVID